LLIKNVVWHITNQVQPQLLKSTTGLQSIFDKLHDLKTNLCKEYEIKRERAVSPPTQSKTLATSEGKNSGVILIVQES